jgi:hypothetical protein
MLYDGGADFNVTLRGCGSGRLSGNAHLGGHINHERARFESQKLQFSVFSFQFSVFSFQPSSSALVARPATE